LQKYGFLSEKNYIAAMKSKVKRTILILLVAIILFSASMAWPALQGSQYKEIVQGAAIGLMIAAIVIIISTLVEYLKANKKG
jgi:hypothetical protein